MKNIKFGSSDLSIKFGRLIKMVAVVLMIMSLAGCAQAASEPMTVALKFEDVAADTVTTIALGNSNTPCGIYAQEIFTNLGMWDDLQSKISYGTNVKAVLAQVEAGSVDCGIVYATDAANLEDVTVTDVATESELTSVVSYPVALTANAIQKEAAEVFLNFLVTSEAKGEFESFGFEMAAEDTSHEVTFTKEATVTIFAAASLTESLTAVQAAFEEANPNIDLEISFNSSGTLQTQIEQGAQVDVFFPAAQKQMTALITEGYIDESTKIDLLENKVVLIVPTR